MSCCFGIIRLRSGRSQTHRPSTLADCNMRTRGYSDGRACLCLSVLNASLTFGVFHYQSRVTKRTRDTSETY
nr:unnamed protein product [Spirometra erinaceieuropaei]